MLYALPAAAGPILSIQPASSGISVGQTFSVNVFLTDAVDLYAYQFDVGFDPSVLSANGISEGPLLATAGTTFFIPGSIDNVTGTISNTANALFGVVPGANGSGVLATVSLKAIGAGTSNVTLFGVTLLDSSFSGITVSTLGGSATASGVVAPEPGSFLLLAGGLLGFWRRGAFGSRSN
jgi:general secretion pathway protein D